MTSCDAGNSWMMCRRFNSLEHSEHVVEPLLRRYQRRRVFKSGWVLFFLSHCSIICADCSNASILPSSGHLALYEHDSMQPLQLGHIGLLSSWCARNVMVSAIPRTCFIAQTWRAKEDCAMCGGQRSSWRRQTEHAIDFFGRGRLHLLVDGEPKIKSDFLFPTSISCHQQRYLQFKWEHLRQAWSLCAIHCNPLLGSMVTYAVQLPLPAELGESCVVVLVHLNMWVVRGEGEISAVDEDSLEDVAVAAPQQDTIRRQVRHPF